MNTDRTTPVCPTMRRFPAVTVALVAMNLLAYRLELASGGASFCADHGLVPARPTVLNALTALFLHDPASWAHLAGNLVCLVVLGLIVEREVGGRRFAVLYLLAGLGAAAMHVMVDPTTTVPMVGASGAIFGLMPAAVAVRPRLVGFVGGYAGYNVACVLLGIGGSVAVGAHVGGFAVGALFMMLARARGGVLEAA